MRELSVIDAAQEFPDRSCLVTNDCTLTYGDVADRVVAATRALVERGARSGAPIAITPTVDVASAVWIYAAFELGCPAVLLHPGLTGPERARILEQAEPALTLPAAARPGSRKAHPSSVDFEDVPPDRTLAIVYSSGTTGAPRGALLSRRAFVASSRAHAENLGWRPDDRWLLAMPPAHVGGLSILTRCLIARRTVVLADGAFSPSRTIALLCDERVTLLSLVPTMLSRLIGHDSSWNAPAWLRAVLVGGAPLAPSLRRRAIERGLPILTTYGFTEACSQVTTQRRSQSGTEGSGAPLAGVRVRVADGEVQVRGDTMMDGYVGDAHSEARWTDDGWFRTRDQGRFEEDGQLHVSGRLDDVIVTGGENVAPAEVEAVIADVDGVESVCVFGMPDAEWGQEVVAAIAGGSRKVDPGGLRAALSSQLASFKRPKRVAWLDALPLNRNGKIDRRRVAERAASRLRPI